MKGRPLFDNVVVELTPQEDMQVSEAGIILPRYEEEGRDQPASGKIVAVGGGLPDLTSGELLYYPMDVKVGDVVYFKDSDGFSLIFNGKPSVLLNIREILFVEE